MAKRLSYEQRSDKLYVEQMLKEFILAVRNDDAEEAEDTYNEITGVLCAMRDRMTND